MKLVAIVILAALLGTGCQSVSTRATSTGSSAKAEAPLPQGALSPHALAKLMVENEAWRNGQVARLAAACNLLAISNKSPAARREALRLKAAFATSSYSIIAGPNALVQTLDLLSMSILLQRIWIEEARAVEQFGEQNKTLEEALLYGRWPSLKAGFVMAKAKKDTVQDGRKSGVTVPLSPVAAALPGTCSLRKPWAVAELVERCE